MESSVRACRMPRPTAPYLCVCVIGRWGLEGYARMRGRVWEARESIYGEKDSLLCCV